MDVEGAVALVTGGGSGLGAATARRLHADGAAVVLADLPHSPGAQLAAELGERVRFVPTDVTSPDEVTAALDVASGLGPLRIAVNCAGVGAAGRILGRNGPLPLEDFRAVIDVNLVGTFNVIRLAAERIAATEPVGNERGVIVNTASIAAFEGQIGQVAYAASKAGIVGLTVCAARDLAERLIRVVTIAPGIFDTPMLQGLPDPVRESLGAQVPHPSRLGDPQEFASLARYVVSNPMLNGETIRLDGAIRMGPR